MLDFDTLCGRKTPSVAAIINPTGEATFEKFLFGSADVLIPVYSTLSEAVERHGKTPKMLAPGFHRVEHHIANGLKVLEVCLVCLCLRLIGLMEIHCRMFFFPGAPWDLSLEHAG